MGDICSEAIWNAAITLNAGREPLKLDAVTTAKILDGRFLAADIAADAVTTAKIADANDNSKIADVNVTKVQLPMPQLRTQN
jgi:hypothetical protein